MADGEIALVPYGLGPIGKEILKKGIRDDAFNVLGGVDIAPDLVGKPLTAIFSEAPANALIVSDVSELSSIAQSYQQKIAVHATGSSAPTVWPQIRQLLDLGYHVVTTCEEMLYPWDRYPSLSQEINDYAKSKGLSVIGTGINPGFVMDTLPLMATTVTDQIQSVKAIRQVNVGERRVPLQKKVGIAKSEETFRELAKEGKIGHVGLEETVRMVAAGLNVHIDELTTKLEPTYADQDYELSWCQLAQGDVSGQYQKAKATTSEGRTIEMELTMALGIEQKDEMIIKGTDPVHLLIPNGIFGDTATASMIINTGKRLITQQQSGLLTMIENGLPFHSVRPFPSNKERV
ncbi:4-hydroxy-tetrahydrodipicolinate reductase [Geomicrobium halophilum]|uniref:4-hydroxy-tetrahydrodipicolinate reductase n=1 Tax=Geomicrobium halophilum TaxID=549000 RepID=A0A841Q0L7_9BACL|nr:hypothetical protein [Geomicrobium halophilum]MBB6451293.1 4-hydroxy-tetrahydrodipicolinate reductase [Geomicrobium halophilum]